VQHDERAAEERKGEGRGDGAVADEDLGRRCLLVEDEVGAAELADAEAEAESKTPTIAG
jgi:hypothetical protein